MGFLLLNNGSDNGCKDFDLRFQDKKLYAVLNGTITQGISHMNKELLSILWNFVAEFNNFPFKIGKPLAIEFQADEN